MKFKFLTACLILLVIGVAAYCWKYERPIEARLSDGRVVFYEKLMKGTKISESEFETDIYSYSLDYFQPDKRLIDRWFDRLKNYGASGQAKSFHFSPAPERMIGGVRDPKSTAYEPSIMQNGFGQQSLVFWRSTPEGQAGGWVNSAPLPKGVAQWEFDFKTEYSPSIGRITIPNRSFHPKPKFKGTPPPLESRNGKNVLKLVSARSLQGMTFDASGCPDLLPCQVLGVRVTDAWGNTALVYGSLDSDGKTIGMGSVDACSGIMQSPNWHVRIAICRGPGAKFAANEIVFFDNLPAINPGTTRILRGRGLTLKEVQESKGGGSKDRVYCSVDWQLDGKDADVWPIVTRIVGWTVEDGAVKIGPDDKGWSAGYQVKRDRFIPGKTSNPKGLIQAPMFKTHFLLPPTVVDYALQVALEEQTVFDFYVNVDY
jgi:hypothetical protein